MAELTLAAVVALGAAVFLMYNRRKSVREERRRVIARRLQALTEG